MIVNKTENTVRNPCVFHACAVQVVDVSSLSTLIERMRKRDRENNQKVVRFSLFFLFFLSHVRSFPSSRPLRSSFLDVHGFSFVLRVPAPCSPFHPSIVVFFLFCTIFYVAIVIKTRRNLRPYRIYIYKY